jgi:hypothetical protein
LLNEGLSGSIHDNLEMILSSALSLNTIINDLLDFSAIEAGRLSIRPVEFLAARGHLAKLTSRVEEQAALKGIASMCRIHERVPDRIVTDPSRVRQILINLLNNAFKFTLEGSVSLEVRSPDPDHLSFAVADTGIGIPADRIKDLFKSFTQLDATVNKRFGGTGLGLAISKEIGRAHGGTIEVRSEEGVGSVFTLTIPVEIPEEREGERPPRSLPPPLRVRCASFWPRTTRSTSWSSSATSRTRGIRWPQRWLTAGRPWRSWEGRLRPGAHGRADAGDERAGRHPGHPARGRAGEIRRPSRSSP